MKKRGKKDIEPRELSEAAARALQRFVDGPQLSDRAEAITALLSQKALAHVVRTEAFQSGLVALAENLKPEVQPEIRLGALAQLSRIAQSAKPMASDIRKRVLPTLESALPPVRLLKEADDRGYVAKACSWTSGQWALDYAVQAIVDEETAEKVRAEFVAIAFSRAASLAEIFSRLGNTLSRIKPETDSPADSVARRLTRIVMAVRGAMVNSLLPPGRDVGEAYGAFARLPFLAVGLPVKEEAGLALAREVVLGVHDLVRTRFSVATDAGTYTAIKFCKRLFPGSSWPPGLRKHLELVAGSVIEALLLLAKQGITSPPLVEHLELVVGYRERADALLRELAEGHPEIPEQVRSWLKKERLLQRPSDGDALSESRELRMDPTIGQILLDLQRLTEAQDAVGSSVLPALKLYDPSQVTLLDTYLTRVGVLARGIEEIAKRRQLGLVGSPGSEIDYAPKYFEATHGAPGQRVKVIRPAVVRLSENGKPGEVVVKGLVE